MIKHLKIILLGFIPITLIGCIQNEQLYYPKVEIYYDYYYEIKKDDSTTIPFIIVSDNLLNEIGIISEGQNDDTIYKQTAIDNHYYILNYTFYFPPEYPNTTLNYKIYGKAYFMNTFTQKEIKITVK